jgi:PAS domain S-box-containing protein
MENTQLKQALEKYQILGTLQEDAFDEITRLAAEVCEVPIAMISFIDNDSLWFKSHVGIEIERLDRNHSISELMIRDNKFVVIPDATLDPRFQNVAVVAGWPKIRFYAGAPLVTPEGVVIGCLCALSTEPHNISKAQEKSLQRMTKVVMHFLETRIQDIDEKKAAQRDLEKQKEFLNAVLENLSDGVIACDGEGNVHLSNKASRRFHGLEGNKAVPQEEWAKYYQLYHADGKTIMKMEEIPLFRAFHGEIIKDYEMVVRSVDGSSRHLLTNGSAFFDKSGNKIGAVVTLGDMTEMRNALLREHTTNVTLKTLIDMVPVAITILDEQKKVTTWNKASEEITEWKEQEVLGKSMYEAMVGNDANTQRIGDHLTKKGEKFTGELEYRTKYGNKVDLQISVVPLVDGNGNPAGSMGVSVNISDIRERERRLTEANRALQEASRAKSIFLANMSHEIRTPLNGVIAMSELLSMSSLDDDQRDMMRTIQSSANNLLTILSDILDFSKVEAGKLEIEHVKFDLKDLVVQAVRSVEPVAMAKNLRLNVMVPGNLDQTFKGDPGRIRQVLLNLISNSIKFTEQGEITTYLSVRLDVTDTGIGIPRAQIGKLFNAFSQADASTTRRFGGTGLGLSISSRLVELMKGEIGVESKEGLGSRFWFTIPLETTEAKDSQTKTLFGESVHLQQMVGTHVLVAEDNPVNQQIAVAMLKKLGITCDVVENGKLALEALKTKQFDLVLMDCMMPEMDGYETTRAIRAVPNTGFQNIPIVAVTANALTGDREKCIASGMDDYLTKPVHIQNLAKVLSDIVRIVGKTA